MKSKPYRAIALAAEVQACMITGSLATFITTKTIQSARLGKLGWEYECNIELSMSV